MSKTYSICSWYVVCVCACLYPFLEMLHFKTQLRITPAKLTLAPGDGALVRNTFFNSSHQNIIAVPANSNHTAIVLQGP